MNRNQYQGGFVARRRHQNNRPEAGTSLLTTNESTSLLIDPVSQNPSPRTSLWSNNKPGTPPLPTSNQLPTSFSSPQIRQKSLLSQQSNGFTPFQTTGNQILSETGPSQFSSLKGSFGSLGQISTSISNFAAKTATNITVSLTEEAISDTSQYSDQPIVDYLTPIVDMPCRERTSEFRTAAKSLQMKQQAANGYHQKPKRKIVADSVQFNQMAKRIGRDLSQTCAKVEKLAMLSKKKSLFNDRVGEIDELTAYVKQDISGLNKQIATLQEFVQNHVMAQPGFEAGSGSGGHHGGRPQGQNHSRSVVVGLQSRLAAVSTEFKTVLEVRTENLKQQKSRREKFSQSQPIPSSLPPSASSGNMGSVLLSDEYAASNGFVSLDMDNLEKQRMQQQVQLIDEQDQYAQSRSNAMENIETSIVELGSIFRQLAHLISEQGETIQRIDANVEETSMNVEAAHMELLKYFRSISSNRWLAIKVFGILIVFFIIFIVFMT